MKKLSIFLLLIGTIFLTQSCQKNMSTLTELEKKSIIDSAKVTVQKVFDLSNELNYMKGLDYYSEDSDAYYSSNGTILTFNELKKSYSQIGASIEILKNSIISWNSTVLSEDTVVFTLPINLTIKLVGVPEYNGQLVWSGVLQRRNKKWMIIQSHESWLNCVEVVTALTPQVKDLN